MKPRRNSVLLLVAGILLVLYAADFFWVWGYAFLGGQLLLAVMPLVAFGLLIAGALVSDFARWAITAAAICKLLLAALPVLYSFSPWASAALLSWRAFSAVFPIAGAVLLLVAVHKAWRPRAMSALQALAVVAFAVDFVLAVNQSVINIQFENSYGYDPGSLFRALADYVPVLVPVAYVLVALSLDTRHHGAVRAGEAPEVTVLKQPDPRPGIR